jgi:DNA-directed RNA polymerase specialized sigma24 family protein
MKLKERLQNMTNLIQETKQLDQELRELVTKIQQPSLKVGERRRGENELFLKIEKSGKLNKFCKWQNLPDYKDIYSQALADSFVYIVANIKEYNPDRASVMAWVNQTLWYKFYTAYNKTHKFKRNNIQIVSLNSAKNCSEGETNAHVEFVDSLPSKQYEHEDKEYLLVLEFVEHDPKGVLKSLVLKSKNGNRISLQEVLLMRLQDKTLEEISDKYQISLKSISSFFQRNIATVKDYILKHTGIIL